MKFLIKTTILLVLLAFAVFAWETDLFDVAGRFATLKEQASDSLLQEIARQLETPTPLRLEKEQASGSLTASGVIEWTNRQRASQGLTALASNAKLAQAARLKTSDILAKQYFEHTSPDGKDAGDLANEAGYRYVVLGENLALGNFASNQTLVQAWMDSPGHRANIVNQRFQELGAAVQKGTYEGRQVWVAVQEFGTSSETCPLPDVSLRERISTSQVELEQMSSSLAQQRASIEAMSPKRGATYREAVAQYNAMVESYNSALKQTEDLITTYNDQVAAANACAQGS